LEIRDDQVTKRCNFRRIAMRNNPPNWNACDQTTQDVKLGSTLLSV
jgi:hypothetical protein